ncbi:hypothetical protein [Streptomyces sp. NPDC087212]|uniref:hypothetical protein n=1 Tax=Streptomyces sp. NPDC087212 TaxID=3365766 RepID=UPI0037F7C2C2
MDQGEEPKALVEGWSIGLRGALGEIRQRLLTDVLSHLDSADEALNELDRICEEEKRGG